MARVLSNIDRPRPAWYSSVVSSFESPFSALLGIEAAGFRRPGLVLAFVGAGGKTSAMFALARELGHFGVIVTTTTKIRDPRHEADRLVDRVIVDPLLAAPAASGGASWARDYAPARGGVLVLGSATEEPEQKIVGIHATRVRALREFADIVLVEADGARGRSIKAPAVWEPVVPDCADIVVGVIGLDCLGAPLGPELAHRSELLGELVGCAQGEKLSVEHLVRLTDSPDGLFKGAPPDARRIILLTKTDIASLESTRALAQALRAGGRTSAVVACSLRSGAEVRA